MNRKILFPLMLVTFAFVFLSGCLQSPLEDTETSAIYKFKEDASFEMILETSGTLTSAADQWEDCDAKIKSFIDMAISFSQMQPDLNEDQKRQIEGLKKMKEILKCEFEKNEEENTGVIRISFDMTEDAMKLFAEVGGAKAPEAAGRLIEKNEDGTIEVNIGFPSSTESTQGGMPSGGNVKELRVFVEGKVLEMKPESYTKEKDYYVFRDLESLKDEILYIKYKPESAAFLSLLGFDLTFEMLLLVIGAIVAIIVIIIVLIVWRRKKKRHVMAFEEKTSEIKLSPEQEERQAIIGEERKGETNEEILVDRPAEGSRPWQEKLLPVEKTKPPQSPDERKIERLVSLLKPKRFEYTEKEIREVLAEEGYSKEIADEVIRRLGI